MPPDLPPEIQIQTVERHCLKKQAEWIQVTTKVVQQVLKLLAALGSAKGPAFPLV